MGGNGSGKGTVTSQLGREEGEVPGVQVAAEEES